ncbi:nuclear transport factor 2 family protein [Paractinoplanes lichenicola]|uniref:Nuclear transport factor 2 family protein n=1 Tax=Paractinoplanes lichenicola TaxID=2802976 RepID=A0ABS1VL45_9ACTN|nr:nuclear transport factor 2 family protein [Actinoplanes lichenicola]MBL7255445.1 nuclear transport factor 2 family protein [Actinoplanes lichenicola]
MTFTADDRTAVLDLINRHGHLCDAGDFEGLAALFTPDATYDVTALGGGVLAGPSALREAALALGDANPVAHHVTNVVLTEATGSQARVVSKGLGVMADGTVSSVTYDDTVTLTAEGWRIAHRTVRPRRRPLHA